MFTKLTKLASALIHDESGQGSVEYAGMLAVGAFVALVAYQNIGVVTGAITNTFLKVSNALAQIQ